MTHLAKRLVPVDLLFSRRHFVSEGHRFYTELSSWSDVPLASLEPQRTAVAAILARDGSLSQYLDFELKRLQPIAADPNELERALRARLSPVRRMVRRPVPVVEAIERDRLILANGEIEGCLAKLKNRLWTPALMPVDVAEAWDSRPPDDLEGEIARQDRKSFYTPIMHPRFRKWRVSRLGTKRLDMMRRFLGPTRQRLSLLDIGCNTGFYSFHFFRQGFDVSGIDYDQAHLEIARAQRSMYSAPISLEMGSFADFRPPDKYDIVLGLSVFWHMLGWGQFPASMTPKELGGQLEDVVGHALFWESGERANEMIENITSHSGLVHYTKLGHTDATGIENREFGVFTRKPAAEAQTFLRQLR